MARCCSENDTHLQELRRAQSQVLWAVLALNAVMFAAEFLAGWLAGSTALLADSLDMLGDTLVYTLSLMVIAQAPRYKAISAGFKGTIMLVFGLFVLAEAVHRVATGAAPLPTPMLVVGSIALAANLACLCLLTRHRRDDVNMRSSWVCSRNDLVANSGVIVAGLLVGVTGRAWPDLVIGSVIAALFVYSAMGVLSDARRAWRSDRARPAEADAPVK